MGQVREARDDMQTHSSDSAGFPRALVKEAQVLGWGSGAESLWDRSRSGLIWSFTPD